MSASNPPYVQSFNQTPAPGQESSPRSQGYQPNQSQDDAYKADADARARINYGQNLSPQRVTQTTAGQQNLPHIGPLKESMHPQRLHGLPLSPEFKSCESQAATLVESFEAGNDWPKIDDKLGVPPGFAKRFWVNRLKKDHPESQGARRKTLNAKSSRRQNDRRKKSKPGE